MSLRPFQGDSGGPAFNNEHEVLSINAFKLGYPKDDYDICILNASSASMGAAWFV